MNQNLKILDDQDKIKIKMMKRQLDLFMIELETNIHLILNEFNKFFENK